MTELSKGQSSSTPKASPAGASAETVTAAGPAGEVASFRGHAQPIVVNFKDKKKRKYSRRLKGLQQQLRSGTKVTDRLFDAISAGIGKYRKRSDRSSEKKRDGLLKDIFKNSASGLGASLKKSSKVPSLLAKSVNKKAIKRQVNLLKAFSLGLGR